MSRTNHRIDKNYRKTPKRILKTISTMDNDDMFESSVRSAGDQAGVFEYNDETGYFYLYEIKGKNCQKVLSAIQILTGKPDFKEHDITIRWDAMEQAVGLFIHDNLWAVFDLRTGMKYGGDYVSGRLPEIPAAVGNEFKPQ